MQKEFTYIYAVPFSIDRKPDRSKPSTYSIFSMNTPPTIFRYFLKRSRKAKKKGKINFQTKTFKFQHIQKSKTVRKKK
jgi:hypothetical protein